MDPAAQLQALLDLEARHEDLLERLDELDRRVEGPCPSTSRAGARQQASTAADRGGPTC